MYAPKRSKSQRERKKYCTTCQKWHLIVLPFNVIRLHCIQSYALLGILCALFPHAEIAFNISMGFFYLFHMMPTTENDKSNDIKVNSSVKKDNRTPQNIPCVLQEMRTNMTYSIYLMLRTQRERDRARESIASNAPPIWLIRA